MDKIIRQKTDYYPVELINKVNNLATTKAQKNKYFHIISLMAIKSRREFGVDTEFMPFAKNYFIEVLGHKYFKTIKPLKEAGIIESDNSYSVDKGICKDHRLNPKLYHTNTNYEKVVFKYSYPKVWKDANVDKKIGNTESYHKEHIKTLEGFILDKEHLYNIANEVLQDAYNKPFLNDKRSKQEYINSKRIHLFASIENVCDPKARYARRNNQNFRLDNNFTNMAKPIRQAIFKANDLISIDLKSSQYSILLKILKDDNVTGDDVDRFEELILSGQLYEYIRDNSNEPTRNDAKSFMMNVAFGRHYYITERKKIFAELFPTISQYLNNWKIRNGYKEVPKCLQRMESDLFIDRIKTDLCKIGILNTTCHDSIAVKKQDEDQAVDIMLKHFTDFGLQGKVKNESTNEIMTI